MYRRMCCLTLPRVILFLQPRALTIVLSLALSVLQPERNLYCYSPPAIAFFVRAPDKKGVLNIRYHQIALYIVFIGFFL